MQEGKKDGTYVALDAAGNQVDTPGMIADLDDELAITFTTESGGLNPAVTEISAYTID